MKKALIVVDLQNDYLWNKRKPIFSYDTERLIKAVNTTIDKYKSDGEDIIYIAQVFPNLPTNRLLIGFSIKGTEGAAFYDGLNIASDIYFEKNLPDAYSAKKFKEFMSEQAYGEVAICGLDECGCVGATAKGAIKTGVKVTMLNDCIATRFPEKKVEAMRSTLIKLGVQYV